MTAAENKAVFLSYASQDAEAARRVCDALRSGGIDVWFDADGGLEHGDEWDAKIRRQIKDCVLFIPIISANTQARHEGYFRIEWDLAAERARGIASGVAFILPVVIDDTREPDALVPDRFRTVQWTRIRGGEVPADVQQRLVKLWSHRLGTFAYQASRPTATPPSPRNAAAQSMRRLGAGFAFAAVLGSAGWWYAQRSSIPPAGQSEATASTPEVATGLEPATSEPAKAIAVLAFANQSDDRANEYFADGISEELLNVLARVPGLKVSARTSAFSFKGKETPIPEIARQLGVTYVVEGSVRKQGDKVRITAKLIKAADGFHLWSDTFNRDLKDIFAVQDEIAGLIGRELQLKLASTGVARAVHPEALNLLLEARYFWNQRGEQAFDRAEALLNRALALDAGFARAHAALADVWLMRATYRLLDGGVDVATELRNLRASATRASELDPSLINPVAARAYGLMLENRMAEAGPLFASALRHSPDNPTFLYWRGLYLMNQGDAHAARQDYEKARKYDPMAFIIWNNSAECALALGHYDEAATFATRAHEVRPGGFVQSIATGAMAAWLAGRREEAVALARSTRRPELQQLPWLKASYAIWVLRQAELNAEASAYGAEEMPTLPVDSYQRGFLFASLGRFAEAIPYLEKMPPYLYYLLASSPIFDPWRNEPQFQALVEKLNWSIPYAKAWTTRLEALRR